MKIVVNVVTQTLSAEYVRTRNKVLGAASRRAYHDQQSVFENTLLGEYEADLRTLAAAIERAGGVIPEEDEPPEPVASAITQALADLMVARRFAQDTKVPTGQSQGEVKDLLKRAGSDQTAIYEDADKAAVAFRIAGRYYRITVPVKLKAANPEQEERRAWRLALLLIKAKLEAVKEGATTIEREFLADMVTPDNRTVSEWIAEPLRLAYESGKMPTTLLLLTGPAEPDHEG